MIDDPLYEIINHTMQARQPTFVTATTGARLGNSLSNLNTCNTPQHTTPHGRTGRQWVEGDIQVSSAARKGGDTADKTAATEGRDGGG